MFTTKRIIEFGMCDSAGVLYFANIFRLMHSAYEEFIISSDLDNNYFEHETFLIPLVNVNADYKQPIELHEVVDVNITVENIGDSSFKLKTEFYDFENNLKVSVNTTHVFIDKTDLKKRSIPEEFLKLLNEHKN
jgi:YbgC/YbaW family acyl-CoA thioester hydrolase